MTIEMLKLILETIETLACLVTTLIIVRWFWGSTKIKDDCKRDKEDSK